MKEICSLMAPFSCIWWHKMQLDLLFSLFFLSCRESKQVKWWAGVPSLLSERIILAPVAVLVSVFSYSTGSPGRCEVNQDVRQPQFCCSLISLSLCPAQMMERLLWSDAASSNNVWFLLCCHHIYCPTATKIPAARWRRSEEQPHVHAWVGLRRADKQVVGYNCAQYDCTFSFCIFLHCGRQKPYILLWGCSGR